MDKTTDVQIAELLASQTYAERMEMAEIFRDYINTWLEDQERQPQVDSDLVAFWLECYADLFPDEEAPAEGG